MTTTSTDQRHELYRELGLWDGRRLGDLVTVQAAKTPDRELFVFEGRRVTYGQFDTWVRVIASDLVARAVGRGDRIMVQLPNCLEALALQVAAFRIGALGMPVVPIYREYEVRQILADSTPVVIAVAAELGSRRPADEIDALLAETGHTPLIKYVVGQPVDGWRAVPRPGDVDEIELPEPLDADEPAVLLYTSGTTSAPKGALLSSAALIAHLHNFQKALDADEDSVILAATPLSHLGGFIAGVIMPAFLGGRSVIMSSWRPDDAVAEIERERVSIAMGATVFLSDLVNRYEAGQGEKHRLTLYACAGATMPPSLVERAEAVGVRAMRCYGMTETAGVCAAAPSDAPVSRRAHWDGKVLPGMEIEAVDFDKTPLPAGEEGELRIRGPQLLARYTDPDRTREQLDDNGWFYPGDIGVVDAEGWIRMSGRLKDIINRGGEKFSTLDIEAALAAHPDVLAVAVTAVPDERLGEAVGAWLVLRDGTPWGGPQPIIDHLERVRLARQKIPTHWVVVDSLPTTASGKVQKNRLTNVDSAVN
ncbi:class I adenylate-forming enzyme family protein [uncultured Jatrophihabitans sp.]|uniref:class I adenylate-forming enzyme family protein n=1 Tax=uncultured Jatrophihabitans sp. TaxID=1610747 RepID=UPI0035CBB409